MQLRLKVVKGKPRGHSLSFPVGEFMFGSGPECDIRPNSDLVSRQHCLLEVAADTVTIRDLGSRNGTLVNGQLVAGEQQLHHDDMLQIGPLVLLVQLGAESPAEGGPSLVDTSFMERGDTAMQEPELPETAEVPTALSPFLKEDAVQK